MKSIYASKLFKTSKRKERIEAAMLAQSNLELMQQLAEDLDDEYQTPKNLGDEEEPSGKDESDDTDLEGLLVDEEVDPETDLVTMNDLKAPKQSGNKSLSKPSKNSSVPGNKSEGSDTKPEDSDTKPDTSGLIPDSPMNEKPESAEASTQTNGSEGIKAATLADLNILKNTLNSREETSGVNRIAQKENEVWIYYNDDVNLNDIMVDVIEMLTDSEYQQLEFNRLARSDNAIVFVIGVDTTPEPEQIDPEEEKKIAEEEVIEVAETE